VRPQSESEVLTEERTSERLQRALEITHRQAFVYCKALELRELREMGRIDLLSSVDPPRRKHVDRGRLRLHHAHLHR
jgi:hypothetical protein